MLLLVLLTLDSVDSDAIALTPWRFAARVALSICRWVNLRMDLTMVGTRSRAHQRIGTYWEYEFMAASGLSISNWDLNASWASTEAD